MGDNSESMTWFKSSLNRTSRRRRCDGGGLGLVVDEVRCEWSESFFVLLPVVLLPVLVVSTDMGDFEMVEEPVNGDDAS